MFKIILICLFLASISLSNTSIAKTYQALVIGIIDGDTVEILDEKNISKKIRLSQIDAPEKKQTFGNKSKKALSELIFKKIVTVESDGIDQYQRELATIYLNDVNINKKMVRLGMAWAYRYFVKDKDYLILEHNARNKRKGLWVDENPIEPWKFRRIKHLNSGA